MKKENNKMLQNEDVEKQNKEVKGSLPLKSFNFVVGSTNYTIKATDYGEAKEQLINLINNK